MPRQRSSGYPALRGARWLVALTLVVLCAPAPAGKSAPTVYLGEDNVFGDLNADALVAALDALMMLSHVIGKPMPEGTDTRLGNVHCDDQETALDALIILSSAVDKDVSQFCIFQPAAYYSAVTPASSFVGRR